VILVNNRDSNDPYLNLAIEEFLVRNLNCEDEDYLMLYINEPSIVLGKNQSIYKEVNFEFLRNGQLKLARRITGGGTVYHDEGNLNFSIVSKFSDNKVNNYGYFNNPVINTLGHAGIEASMDHWNNILCRGKKISGSAQFTNRKNILSHGTVLWNANLAVLRACLKDNPFKVESNSVNSVKSAVLNLEEISDRFSSAKELKQFFIEQLSALKKFELTDKDWAEVERLRNEKFRTFEWIYGRSPATKIEKHGTIIEVEEGLITFSIGSITLPPLKGTKYEFQTLRDLLEKEPNGAVLLSEIF